MNHNFILDALEVEGNSKFKHKDSKVKIRGRLIIDDIETSIHEFYEFDEFKKLFGTAFNPRKLCFDEAEVIMQTYYSNKFSNKASD